MSQPPPIDTAGVKPSVRLAVVGAHLAAMPLHWQLTSRDARLVRRCKTAPAYHLYAMAGSTPPKPALVHVGEGGAAIEVEVYDPEFFIDFGFADNNPLRLVAAPAQCAVALEKPNNGNLPSSMRLDKAFQTSEANAGMGANFANRISVKCP